MEKERKEAEKAEVVAQANQQKQMLASEVRSLRGEIQGLKGSMGNPLALAAAPGSPMRSGAAGVLPENVAEALERRKAFEEQFSMTLRSLREELMDTSIKRLSSRSQTPQGVRALLVLSDERIDRIMTEAAKVASQPMLPSVHRDCSLLEHEQCEHGLLCLSTMPPFLSFHTAPYPCHCGRMDESFRTPSCSFLFQCLAFTVSHAACTHTFANARSSVLRVCGDGLTVTGTCGRTAAY